MAINTPENLIERYVEKTASCWNWHGPKIPVGYGKARLNGKHRLAHRLVYEHFRGIIPEGLQLDHLCRNILCVNPAHLEAVTPKENVHRCESPTGRNSRKTHCIHGHPLSGGNLYVPPKRPGRRECRACRREASARTKENVSSP